jgi:hypothetical protein
MPDAPAPVASDLIAPAGNTFPVATQQQREAAFATMQKLRADPDYRAAYLRGNATVKAEVQAAHEATLTPTKLKIYGKDAPEDRASMIGSLQNFADVPEAVQKQLYEGQAVSAEEQKFAQQTKNRLMQDKDWVRKYLDGGRAERQQMVLLNTILTSPTKAK